MTIVAPGEVSEKEADEITSKKDSASKKSGCESAIKLLVENSTSLVILFGWAGCKDRYLSKYSQYYEENGISTIRFTAPISKIRSFSSYRPFAKSFNKILEETLGQNPEISSIYFHVFSMNGCSLYAAFWDQLEQFEKCAEIKAKCKGLIFDSCPAFTSPSQSAQAVSFATLPPSHYHGALRESYRAVLYTFFSFHRGVLWLRSFLDKDIYKKHYAYFKMLTFSNLPTKQLFIYGPADLVCSEDSIEAFAHIQKTNHRVNVSKLRLLDSLHCQHLRSHPRIYAQECCEFVTSGNLPANRSRVDLEEKSLRAGEEEEIPEELAY
ncbi:unnamed protein product [Caenorhabditis angaria]|uniref:Transmembrane protein 53 n=1 Tax=Caenorhabditis angaria TaxID=860376 RepID=A0A9P1I6X1_9PELO|nr:unnamed protein product [Caenorhabditis angaria]